MEYIESFVDKSNIQKERILDMNYKSVTLLPRLEDDKYVRLSSEKIVFCDYIDCSASNTILECISTSTPIILNKLPAIVEYLGEDYPLYIETITDNNDMFYVNT